MSARLSKVEHQLIEQTDAAHLSRLQWKATLLDFFFKVEEGLEQLWTTDMLSALMWVLPSRGHPIIRSLYLRPSTSSTAVFIAENSEPNEDVSMLACFLLKNMIGLLLQKMRTPVLNHLLTVSDV